MFIALLLFGVLQVAVGDECNPGFADTCFTSVQSDLQYMLNMKTMVTSNISKNAVHELCLALDDSLNCTSEIIDEDCSIEEGKNTFHSWLKALRGAYNYVCQGSEERIIHILQGISCWSVEDFIFCTEDEGGLDHIRTLLHTKLADDECEDLHYIMSKCQKFASVGSCREQDSVYDTVKGMLHAFFLASDCDVVKHKVTTHVSRSSTIHGLSTVLATVISLSFAVML